jgi:protein TonB
MKKYVIASLFLLLCAGISFARQIAVKIPREVLIEAEQAPGFPGGPEALKQFLAKKIRYPKNAGKKDIEGKVVVRFIVEADGSITAPEVLQSLDPECDAETLRVVRKMPLWNPGRQHGAFVAVYYTLPVTFSLQ